MVDARVELIVILRLDGRGDEVCSRRRTVGQGIEIRDFGAGGVLEEGRQLVSLNHTTRGWIDDVEAGALRKIARALESCRYVGHQRLTSVEAQAIVVDEKESAIFADWSAQGHAELV